MVPVKTLSSNITQLATFDGFSKFDLNCRREVTTEDTTIEPFSNAWCDGDHSEDVANAEAGDQTRPTAEGLVELTSVLRYKDTLIDELQKSNHELRLKFAEAENKIAQMRVKIDEHCECCSRHLRADYGTGRSSTEDFPRIGPKPWARELKTPDDISNPYLKVRRWQNENIVNKENGSSMGSSIRLKHPNCLSLISGLNTRPQSPATSALTGDFTLVPSPNVPQTRRSGDQMLDAENITAIPGIKCSPLQGHWEINSDQIDYGEEGKSNLVEPLTVRSSPDECILSSRVQRLGVASFTPVSRQSLDQSPKGMISDRYDPASRGLRDSLHHHENSDNTNNNPFSSKWEGSNDTGIVGKLMKDVGRK